MNFVYELNQFISNSLIENSNSIQNCIYICKKLNINKERFEQLLRICPNNDKFKGVIKNKFIKELKKSIQ